MMGKCLAWEWFVDGEGKVFMSGKRRHWGWVGDGESVGACRESRKKNGKGVDLYNFHNYNIYRVIKSKARTDIWSLGFGF